ncbi:MAG TPA: hypothetical protein VGF67_24910 [Ktedonobacteraceae bacterium]|jgi:hypothetical protein
MRPDINAVDLAFVVDTTSSMGSLIAAAQQQMISMLRELTRAADIYLRLGVVEYRDHPPQDSMVSQAYTLSEDLQAGEQVIKGLQAKGGVMGQRQCSMASPPPAANWPGGAMRGVWRFWWAMPLRTG